MSKWYKYPLNHHSQFTDYKTNKYKTWKRCSNANIFHWNACLFYAYSKSWSFLNKIAIHLSSAAALDAFLNLKCIHFNGKQREIFRESYAILQYGLSLTLEIVRVNGTLCVEISNIFPLNSSKLNLKLPLTIFVWNRALNQNVHKFICFLIWL